MTGGRLVKQLHPMIRTLSLSKKHLDKLRALMVKYMGAKFLLVDPDNKERLMYEDQEGSHIENWLYITMVLLPQHLGDWHLDANWMVTHMTAKKFKHPIDYLYEKYIKE